MEKLTNGDIPSFYQDLAKLQQDLFESKLNEMLDKLGNIINQYNQYTNNINSLKQIEQEALKHFQKLNMIDKNYMTQARKNNVNSNINSLGERDIDPADDDDDDIGASKINSILNEMKRQTTETDCICAKFESFSQDFFDYRDTTQNAFSEIERSMQQFGDKLQHVCDTMYQNSINCNQIQNKFVKDDHDEYYNINYNHDQHVTSQQQLQLQDVDRQEKWIRTQLENRYGIDSGFNDDYYNCNYDEKVDNIIGDSMVHPKSEYHDSQKVQKQNRGPTRHIVGKCSKFPIFGVYNPKYVQLTTLTKSQRQRGNNGYFIQRMTFLDVEHKPRIIISERGFNKGIHRWKIKVGHISSRSKPCRHVSKNGALSIDFGIVALNMNKFVSPKTKQPRLCHFDKAFNLYDKTHFGNMGMDVAYYCSNVLPQNKVVLGTCGHNRKDKLVQMDQFVEFEYCINSGNTITMELDCTNNSLRFYINSKYLIGQNVKQAGFCNNGTINIMPTSGKTYFPVIVQQGCTCNGPKKGLLVDLIQ